MGRVQAQWKLLLIHPLQFPNLTQNQAFKALTGAFKVFCNKTIAGTSSQELFSSFCDNILKKGQSEKMCDEAIENTFDKVVKLLAYVSDKDLFAEFYRKKLGRRLLFDRSASDYYEK